MIVDVTRDKRALEEKQDAMIKFKGMRDELKKQADFLDSERGSGSVIRYQKSIDDLLRRS